MVKRLLGPTPVPKAGLRSTKIVEKKVTLEDYANFLVDKEILGAVFEGETDGLSRVDAAKELVELASDSNPRYLVNIPMRTGVVDYLTDLGLLTLYNGKYTLNK